MHGFLLVLHSILRWVVLIAGVLTVGQALRGWLGKREWGQLDDRLGLIFTISLDIQLLVGLILYVVSPLIQAAFADFGEAMSATALRFFTIEHTLLMIVAIVVAHVGRSLIKRVEDPVGKHKRASLFFGVAILLVLVAVPWPFRFADRPWIRLS
jgi:hypothetical protein